MADPVTTKLIFLSAAHDYLVQLRERNLEDLRVREARELIRQVTAETLIAQAADELGIALEEAGNG